MRNGGKAAADAKARKARLRRAVKALLVTGFIAAVAATSYPLPAHAKKLSNSQLEERLKQLELENEQLRNVLDRSRNEVPQIPQENMQPSPQVQIEPDPAQGKALDYSKKIRELERRNKDLELKIAEIAQGLQKNLGILDQSQKALAEALKENESLKQSKSANNKSGNNKSGQEELGRLAKENSALKAKIEELEAQSAQMQSASDPERIGQLQNMLGELQAENRKLAQALAEMSTQALAAEKGRTEDALAAREGLDAKNRLAALEQQYETLKAENQALKKGGKGSGGPELEELKAQNLSLRQTIQAQNEALLASDDAVKLNARLKQENADLKLSLKQGGPADQQAQETIAALQSEITALKKQADEAGASTASLEGLKQTVANLKAENEHLRQATASGNNAPKSGGASDKLLLVKLNDLEQRLEKERAATSEYRKMIKQYQDQGAAPAQAAAEAGGQSVYAPEVRALMLENQELRARLELLEGSSGRKSAPQDQSRQSALEAVPVAEVPVVLPDMPTASELLETEPETKNVQLIRKNYKPLPEMPAAGQLVAEDQDSVTRNLGGDALPDINEISPAAIEPAAGPDSGVAVQTEKNVRQVQNNARPAEERKPPADKSEEKRPIQTNG